MYFSYVHYRHSYEVVQGQFSDLHSLPTASPGTVPVLSEALQALLPALQSAWVYGSVAKQTDTAQSDVDVMLVGEGLQLSQVLAALEPAEAKLGRKINPSCYSTADFERRRAEPDSFVNRVLSQPILPLLGDIKGVADEPA